jgi:ligand-binding sensor domain-containing protein/serine phosphatase RsbU (regulator of sigma subunit)
MDVNSVPKRYLSPWMAVLLALSLAAPVRAAESTLARLSFWMPPESREAFAQAYAEKIVPRLENRGMRPSTHQGRATVDSVFSRLFELTSPAAVTRIDRELHSDPAWQQALRELAGPFHFPADTANWYRFTHYSGPAGPGEETIAGAGMHQGLWHTFGIHDGLPSHGVQHILQDSRGDIWLNTTDGIPCRYDGERFTIFTAEDGLPGDLIVPPARDRRGNIWFGSENAVSRYDGESFTTFTIEDGLPRDWIAPKIEDRQGNMWFATSAGPCRYDDRQEVGEQFTTFTTADGLPDGWTTAIAEDRQGNIWLAIGTDICRYDGQKLTILDGSPSVEKVKAIVTSGMGYASISAIVEDLRGDLWFSTSGGGVSRYDGEKFTTFTAEDGLGDDYIISTVADREGNVWFGSSSAGVTHYDDRQEVGEQFTYFTTENGLGGNEIRTIFEDRDGFLWFGTLSGGVTRYDGGQFTHFTPRNGLPSSFVFGAVQDRRGNLWFGARGGVCRYDGKEFVTFTTEDGMAGERVTSILEDSRGNIWFGMSWGLEGEGLTRFDYRQEIGEQFVVFTTENGLGDNSVRAIAEDRNGNLWFATQAGASRYNGREFVNFTTEDGLPDNRVTAVAEDRHGNLWFATQAGVSRYDGRKFVNFTTEDGLIDNRVTAVFEDRTGNLLFTGYSGGISQYDGRQDIGKPFTTLATRDEYPNGQEGWICEDDRGHLWITAFGSGVIRYDGRVFQTLSRRDGLTDNGAHTILQDRDGAMWITTDGGITRYRPSETPPAVRLKEVIADRSYGQIDAIALPSTQNFVIFAFQGRSFTTRPEQMVYLYRLQGYDDDWRQTRADRVEYTDLPRGDYLFEVKAVDRDLNYSPEPAQIRVEIHPPYRLITLLSCLGLTLIGLVTATTSAFRRRRAFLREQQERLRAQELLNQELEEELQVAHDMQMRLMPAGPPHIEGLGIAGRCLPANHVGGDLFQYFPRDGKLSICVADVTGHAMEAAVPVMMFSGVLESEIEHGHTLEKLFATLNRTLHKKLDQRTFVCFTLGELELHPSPESGTRTFRLINGGFPYPLHYRAATGDVVELQIDAYPLGVRPDTTYPLIEVQLAPGDRIVFCSDGIAEAANARGEILGFERTAETVRRCCAEKPSAEALVDRLIAEVQTFIGETPLEDDMTVVALVVET